MILDSTNIGTVPYNTIIGDIKLASDITDDKISSLIFDLGKKSENSNVIIDYHSCTLKCKIEIFKILLTTDLCCNRQLTVNLINLLKTYNGFSDSFFASKITIFNDIEEFLDIKLELTNEIQTFINNLASFYLSMFLSMHKDEHNYLETYITLPYIVQVLFESLDIYTLSGICEKAQTDKIRIFEKPIKNAKGISAALFDKWKVANCLFNEILKNTKFSQ